MTLFLLVIFVLYLIFITFLLIGWEKIRSSVWNPGKVALPRVSVIIPVRNEACNIGSLIKDLAQQDYPKDKFELLIVDDDSEDATVEEIKKQKSAFELTLLHLGVCKHKSRKKEAITLAVKKATGTLILCTDGDTRIGKQWISSMANEYINNQAKFLSGPVCLSPAGNVLSKIQQIEFLSLIGTGAASIYFRQPNMCNGANMAFEREAFFKVNGYNGKQDIPSGDDEFLMHKIFMHFPGQVKFVKNVKSIVTTSPLKNMSSLLAQRKRWAGKWKYYDRWQIKTLALFVFLMQAVVISSILAACFNMISAGFIMLLLTLKIILEFVFLREVAKFFKLQISGLVFLIIQIIYPFYVLITGMAGLIGPYEWKGRYYYG